MEETYGIAAFRSRQQVMAFQQALARAGVPSSIVSTPRSISVGCGLSVRFELRDARDVCDIYRMTRAGNLIGFYRVQYDGRGHVIAAPMGMEMGYRG